MHKIIIAIDGLSACGKSVTAKRVAQIIGYLYCDSGAMYRAVAAYFLAQHIKPTDVGGMIRALVDMDMKLNINPQEQTTEIAINGHNIGDEIRRTAVSELVSRVSALQQVRQKLTGLQRQLGKTGGVVMDGRDIGTTIFPHAELKLFMTADLLTRGIRRQNELLDKGHQVELDRVIANLNERDQYDSTREISPLRKATDAIELDTTYMTLNEQIDEVVRLAIAKMI